MKKLILTVLLGLGLLTGKAQNLMGDDTVSIYLQDMPIRNYTQVSYRNGVEVLPISSACIVLSKDNLRLAESPDSSVYYLNGNIYAEEYFLMQLWDTCHTTLLAEDEKEEFYFEPCGQSLPWEEINGVPVNILKTGRYGYDTREWDTLLSITGIYPDSTLCLKSCMTNVDPFFDRAIGVTSGRSDTYNGNTFDISGVPNGIHLLDVSINLPAYLVDLHPNWHKRLYKVELSGFPGTRRITFLPGIPACCSSPLPLAATNLKLQGNRLSWNPSPNAVEYSIYRAAASKFRGTWVVQNPTAYRLIGSSNTPNFTIDNLSGDWAYYVVSKNCAGNSSYSVPVFK